jgi:DNA-3-methyladenine glycosylase I
MDDRRRCEWASPNDPLNRDYHDEEWGVPLHEDRKMFELLTLEGFQAGLSWSTILRKRASFRRAFEGFDPRKVAVYDSRRMDVLKEDSGIVRSAPKIRSAVGNAKAFIEIQREFGSFDSYVWRFVGEEPRINRWRSVREIPASTAESSALSSDLVKRGFKFVGPTICYAYMQASGMVNDHVVSCFRYKELGG